MIRILVIEDDATIISLYSRWLEPYGYKISVAPTLNTAMECMLEADILVLDLSIGGGQEVSDIVLSKWAATRSGPAVVISGLLRNREHEYDLLKSGAWNVLEKPIYESIVVSLIHRYASIVSGSRRIAILQEKLEKLESEIEKWKRNTIILALLTVGLGGMELVPRVLALLGIAL